MANTLLIVLTAILGLITTQNFADAALGDETWSTCMDAATQCLEILLTGAFWAWVCAVVTQSNPIQSPLLYSTSKTTPLPHQLHVVSLPTLLISNLVLKNAHNPPSPPLPQTQRLRYPPSLPRPPAQRSDANPTPSPAISIVAAAMVMPMFWLLFEFFTLIRNVVFHSGCGMLVGTTVLLGVWLKVVAPGVRGERDEEGI
ncbi:hypothetical protein P171DRAFT_439692 [Karstenula rhodostoma CBS 690.94]|uniref:Uncharacterized protein n=1 Tax=Karstenula rhodostoma CBS 690.94 TaxID=1392251 RepID=A0A9P4PPU8_9PLEO|nr:hypothetical protein P171DRAFT_439692 [Karstenula rhodostoma CBS 690.94]